MKKKDRILIGELQAEWRDLATGVPEDRMDQLYRRVIARVSRVRPALSYRLTEHHLQSIADERRRSRKSAIPESLSSDSRRPSD